MVVCIFGCTGESLRGRATSDVDVSTSNKPEAARDVLGRDRESMVAIKNDARAKLEIFSRRMQGVECDREISDDRCRSRYGGRRGQVGKRF